MNRGLNDDIARPVVVDTASMDWEASPSPTVWRKRLDRVGPAEAGRVTSVVRYDPGGGFHAHPHPGGEEILVLDGVFSDRTGDYPAGSYLLNPEGFEHSPFSEEGCLLFVKLRQYPGLGRRRIAIGTDRMAWEPAGAVGVTQKTLYRAAGRPETVRLLRIEAGAGLGLDGTGGTEAFVMEGRLEAGGAELGPGGWLRHPAGMATTFRASTACALYLKAGRGLGPALPFAQTGAAAAPGEEKRHGRTA